MADEKDDQTTDDTAEAPEAAADTPGAEAPAEGGDVAEGGDAAEGAEPAAEEAAPEPEPAAEEAAPEPEPAAEEAAPEPEAAAEEAAPEPDADAGEPAAASEPAEELSPKERRRRSRSRHTESKPPRSAEERHAERVTERKAKAVRRRARRLRERAKAKERRAAKPAPEPLAPVHAPVEGTRRVRQGIVVSHKAEKTITVRIDIARRHRRYEKIVRSSSTVHAHDENNDAHEGDVVRVIESRPLSRSKRWALVDVLERAR